MVLEIACSESASQGLFIVGFVEGGLAELDGRLQKDDRILSIENHDLANGTQEEAANIIRVGHCCSCVRFRVPRACSLSLSSSGSTSMSPRAVRPMTEAD